MAKAKITKKNRQALINKKTILLVAISILLVYFAISFVQQKFQERREKQMFADLEQILTAFSNKVENELGEPVQAATNSFCRHEGAKFSTGRLYCGTETGGNFATNSVNEAKAKAEKVHQLLEADSNFRTLRVNEEIERLDEWFHSLNLRALDEGLDCSLRLSFKDLNQQPLTMRVGEPKPGTFGYFIICTDYALREYYPVK